MTLHRSTFRHRTARCILAIGVLSLAPIAHSAADTTTPGISEGFKFSETDGESLYRAICQSCHMPDGQGAQGAGAYPALARNPKLAAAPYPVINILRGRKGMPSFKQMLSDEQVAMVTNYVRTHMGNNYKNMVTAAEVKALR
jgi:mono/diheme cytochrome c family protein